MAILHKASVSPHVGGFCFFTSICLHMFVRHLNLAAADLMTAADISGLPVGAKAKSSSEDAREFEITFWQRSVSLAAAFAETMSSWTSNQKQNIYIMQLYCKK